MMDPLLEVLLVLADSPASFAPVLFAEELAEFSPQSLAALIDSHLLTRLQPATSVTCPACFEDHAAPVEYVEEPPDTPSRAYVVCPQAGRVLIDRSLMESFRLTPDGFADVAASLFQASGPVQERVRHRLWSLGHCMVSGQLHDLFVARGLGWSDEFASRQVRAALRKRVAPVLLSLALLDEPALHEVPVVWLGHLLAIRDDRVAIERTYLESVLSTAAEPTAADFVFRLDGDHWTLSFDGQTAQFENLFGLRYIHYLLQRPHLPVPAQELIGACQPGLVAEQAGLARGAAERELIAQGVLRLSGGNQDPLLDANAKDEYRKRVQEIEDDLAEADRQNNIELAAKLRAEREAILVELGRAVGLRGKNRTFPTTKGSARTSVTNAIGDARRAIARRLPAAGEFMSKSIITGGSCRYEPTIPIDWITV